MLGLLAIPFVLASCGAQPLLEESQPKAEQKRAPLPNPSSNAASLRAQYADVTRLECTSQHGTQIEYLSPNGNTYLWYPGNRRVVVGEWKTQNATGGGAELCYRYGANSYNPATGSRGEEFHCINAQLSNFLENERMHGDAFQLATGEIPFVLKPKRKYSLGQVGRKAGI